jgi:hypothetical protein
MNEKLATELPSLISRQVSHSSDELRINNNKRSSQQQNEYDYGYGYGYDEPTKSEPSSSQQEPPLKRRRFQRRNSKTPAMLLSGLASVISDFDFDNDVQKSKVTPPTSPLLSADDSGLQIAQDLVRQLRLRRQSNVNNSNNNKEVTGGPIF